jgi:hypothetical protein
MRSKTDDIINGMKPFIVRSIHPIDGWLYLNVHHMDGFGRLSALPTIPVLDSDRREEFQHYVSRAKGVARLCTMTSGTVQ